MIKKLTNQILKKMTKEELAAEAGVSVTTVIRWSTTQEPKNPNKGTVLLLKEILSR